MIRPDDLDLALERVTEANIDVERRLRGAVELEERILLVVLPCDIDTVEGRLRFVRSRLNALGQHQALRKLTVHD